MDEKPEGKKWWHGFDPIDIGSGIFIVRMGIALIIAAFR